MKISSRFVFGLVSGLATIICAQAYAEPSHENDSDHDGASILYKSNVKKEAGKASHSQSPNMTYHGGAVYHSSSTMAIFWGPQWSNATFAGDKISGMDSFFSGFGGANYAYAGTEYYDSKGSITANSTYLGHVFDSSAAPSRALSTSNAMAEACKITGNKPAVNTLYVIYTATGAGNVNYCAWHTWGNCSNGASIQVAYIPNLDGIAGCDPQDTLTGHSQGLSAIANVTAHELTETITDPNGTAWYDSTGEEIGDKCAWSFSGNRDVFSNGSQWKLQMEWSNSAYSSGTGLANLSGQKGCID